VNDKWLLWVDATVMAKTLGVAEMKLSTVVVVVSMEATDI
jgi:hypothetical protein